MGREELGSLKEGEDGKEEGSEVGTATGEQVGGKKERGREPAKGLRAGQGRGVISHHSLRPQAPAVP